MSMKYYKLEEYHKNGPRQVFTTGGPLFIC